MVGANNPELLVKETQNIGRVIVNSGQFGFAAAISVYIFAIVAIVSALGFRHSRKQEEVYS